MTRPTVTQAEAWQPDALHRLADEWDYAARRLIDLVDDAAADAQRSRDYWTGASADAAREHAARIAADTEAVVRVLILASVAAHDGADQMAATRADVMAWVDSARSDGFAVADDGSVTVDADPSPLLVLLAGGDPATAEELRDARSTQLRGRIVDALERLAAADADAAGDIADAFRLNGTHRPAATVPAGTWPMQAADIVDAWPTMSQDRIASQIAEMTPEQRDRLIAEFPRQVGNTDGIPWNMRVAANRLNIAEAITAESGRDGGSRQRITFYRNLLGEIDDPTGAGGRIKRQIVAFDPARGSLIELNGDIAVARGVAVLVPGVNTTIDGSAANTATARRFVSGTHGEVAVITYLGGPFPQVHNPAGVLLDAADPHFALEMAPRLVAFTEDLDRVVADGIPVTVIGHSYGGSIVGTAEALGLTSDRTLFLAAAGAGVGVDDTGD